MKNNESLPAPMHLQEDMKDLTRIIFDKIAIFAITFGALAALGSLLRISRYGLNQNICVDLSTYLLIVAILLLRHTLPTMAVASLFVIVLSACGCITFFFSGLATVNAAMLTSCCVVAGAIFGYRTGLCVLIGSLSVIIVAGVLFTSGRLASIYDIGPYLLTPQAWIAQLSGYFVFALGSLTIVHLVQKQLWNSFRELKLRSDELRSSEKKYRLLAENMRDILLLLDTNLTITYISPSATKLFGYSTLELLTSRIDQLLAPEHGTLFIERFRDYIKQAVENDFDLPSIESEYQRKDGSFFYAEFSPSFIRNSEGALTGIQGILRDISDRKAAEKEKALLEEHLRQSEKLQAIGQLAGGIAHDFNNQLAGIMGFAELIKSDHPKASETFTSAQSITAIATRAADLTGKLLAFARKGNYLLNVLDIHAIIGELVVILSRSIDRTISFVQQLDASPSCVKGDPGQLQNALLNIALNARDAMAEGGTLSFSTGISIIDDKFTTPYQRTVIPGRYIHIVISDTGSGIDDAAKRHLFEPFFTTKEPGKGTGMGLAAVYGTIQAHQGIIDVVSTAGEGTSFHIYLPASDEKVSPAVPVKVPEITHGTGTILVIDDETNVNKMISLLLKRLGYTIETCPNGSEALALYQQKSGSIDAVILDLILPGMSGKDVFKKLRSINENIRILICSGYSADQDVQKLITDKKTFFIQKPFTMSELSHQISILLSKKV